MMYLNNKNRLSRSRHSTAQTGHTDRLFCSGDLDLDPMTLTHESDKDILMMYLHTKNKLFRRRFQNVTALQREYNDNFLQYHIFHFHVLPFVLHRWKERHTDLHCKTVALYILVLRFSLKPRPSTSERIHSQNMNNYSYSCDQKFKNKAYRLTLS